MILSRFWPKSVRCPLWAPRVQKSPVLFGLSIKCPKKSRTLLRHGCYLHGLRRNVSYSLSLCSANTTLTVLAFVSDTKACDSPVYLGRCRIRRILLLTAALWENLMVYQQIVCKSNQSFLFRPGQHGLNFINANPAVFGMLFI